MFYGNYEHKVDDKGRVPVPAVFRREIKGDLALVDLRADPCITVYPAEELGKRVENLSQSASLGRLKTRMYKRLIGGGTFMASFDAQGRIMLPAVLRQKVGIKESAVIVGAIDYFEIWDKDTYERTAEPELDAQAPNLLESFGS